jgi:hypothetical protein
MKMADRSGELSAVLNVETRHTERFHCELLT